MSRDSLFRFGRRVSANNSCSAYGTVTSFFVEHCRKISEGHATFDVRVLSGKIAIGDRFGCQDGMGRHVRFHVRKVEKGDGELVKLECIGPIIFDDQFARFTIVTVPFPPPRPDLPTAARDLQPTLDEIAEMKRFMRDWDHYHPLQQAAAICVFRGLTTAEQIAEELVVSPLDIRSAFRGMSDFFILSADKILIR